MASPNSDSQPRLPWWRSIGPALITACVVFGPGSMLISSKIGATHGYIYARWTYLYISIGIGEHPWVKKYGLFFQDYDSIEFIVAHCH